MNKTVNINLAGIFFHIDEDAYLKLQHYLDAIKEAFTTSEGGAEIISDIEMRIAELFDEHLKQTKQVIRIAEVDRIIGIMGQPEDYILDATDTEEDTAFEFEPFENTKNTNTKQHTYTYNHKKLYRDTSNAYVAGVSSGLSHYIGIDALWIRLAWLILFSVAGGGLFVYILLWILVPEAKTTAEKISMTGAPVNISNIEKKIKDEFKNVSDTINTASNDINEKTSSLQKILRSFFLTLTEIVCFCFKLFSKFIGAILITVGISAIFISLISLYKHNVFRGYSGTASTVLNFFDSGDIPFWLTASVLVLLVSIPFFFIFYLGLKLVVPNLKTIGNIPKISLASLWCLAIFGCVVIGLLKASAHLFKESYFEDTKILSIPKNDTIYVRMAKNTLFPSKYHKVGQPYKLAYGEDETLMLHSKDVGIVVKSTTDTVPSISIRKNARGRYHKTALENAKNLIYNYQLNGNTLTLDGYSKTRPNHGRNKQEIKVILYLPEQRIVHFGRDTRHHLYKRAHRGNIVNVKKSNHYLKILNDKVRCLDCYAK